MQAWSLFEYLEVSSSLLKPLVTEFVKYHDRIWSGWEFSIFSNSMSSSDVALLKEVDVWDHWTSEKSHIKSYYMMFSI